MNTQSIWAMHGFLGHSSDFDILKELGLDLQAVNLVGHGDFQSSSEMFSTKAQVQYWLQKMPMNHILMGYSMGGRLALQMVSHHPSFFKGLILIGATPGLQDPNDIQERRIWDIQQAAQIRKLGMPSFLEQWQQMSIIQSQQNIDSTIRKMMQHYRNQQDPEQMAWSMEYFGTGTMPHCWEFLPKISIPVFLVVGEDDAKYLAIAEQMLQRLPNAHLCIIPQAGHCAHLEQPLIFVQKIQEWLQQF